MVLHVAVISGSRADYGPLRPLLLGLAADVRIQLSTLVCAVGDADEADRQLAAVTDDGLDVAAAIRAAGPGRAAMPMAVPANPLPMVALAIAAWPKCAWLRKYRLARWQRHS